ncbi:MAG: hypothetical protein OEW68_15515 [Gammaproteobacteria bacterium]|nr:hypothetical protein [Gammaproteobacteria bacterium]MDH4316235.1 hypothetical protein [Gammaproteobacteria bacterium]MDH5214113.1 hypothetical protein [Gammaproteobacteria bacterium]MDH5501236.1 hypothetical protein [Gammaproteobacteria bacterium]
MSRIGNLLCLGFLCASCGGGINSYEDAANAQAEIMSEMIDVLEGVTDQASADRAAGKIEDLGNRLADVIGQLRDLPEPTASEITAMSRKQGARMQEFQSKAMPQMMKLAEYPVLFEAWTRAMENIE